MQESCINCGVSFTRGGDSLWKVAMLLFKKMPRRTGFSLEHDMLFLNLLLHGPEDFFEVLLHHQLGLWWLQLVGSIIIMHHGGLWWVVVCPVIMITQLWMLDQSIWYILSVVQSICHICATISRSGRSSVLVKLLSSATFAAVQDQAETGYSLVRSDSWWVGM